MKYCMVLFLIPLNLFTLDPRLSIEANQTINSATTHLIATLLHAKTLADHQASTLESTNTRLTTEKNFAQLRALQWQANALWTATTAVQLINQRQQKIEQLTATIVAQQREITRLNYGLELSDELNDRLEEQVNDLRMRNRILERKADDSQPA